MNRRILNRIPVGGFSRYTLNESVKTNDPAAILASRLKSFMKKYNYDSQQMYELTKSALNLIIKDTEIKTSLTKDQQDELQSMIHYFIDSCVEDSRATHWKYEDFIFDDSGTAYMIDGDDINNKWADGWLESFDPNGRFDLFEDWWYSASDTKQKDFVNYANDIVFKYFNGNTNASWKDY